jgi:rapamycin-insensitive companion of mTOR
VVSAIHSICVTAHEFDPDRLDSVLPFLADEATSRRRAAAYRALRYLLDRDAWGKMLLAGLEWIVIR